ncbi:MAG TPA: HAD-IA family hydrolase [Gammaproteobacteria bacterium]|nr:HAD-IA family hydrolase [Gammaproteobacteria bacterium]
MKALIFDCDGVLVDTERDGHRVSFNRAFSEFGLDTFWDVELYGELLKVAGGKERIRAYFETAGWPKSASNVDAFVADLHKRKTEIFMDIIASGQLPLRSGILRLVDEASAAGVRLGVCTTSNAKSVAGVLDLMGAARKNKFEFVLAGDVVSKKKPDPEIYVLARNRLGLPGSDCVVIEDSRNGLLAALGAGMRCLITTSTYTIDEDFEGAARVVPELGDPPNVLVSLADLESLTASGRA